MKLIYDSEYFSAKDTLECGQVFRFIPFNNGYKVFSRDKCAVLYRENDKTVVEINDADKEYFENYFDVKRDYKKIVDCAKTYGGIIEKSSLKGKGIRILNQDKTEILFSFIISQNNNIPRIKKIIEKLCVSLGEEKSFMGERYFAFPSAESMAKKDLDFYYSVGLGYRAPYIKKLADDISAGLDLTGLNSLSTENLKKSLLSIYGVGPKVADCVSLFGFHKTDSFPVDTWIEKVYREDFGGTLSDRKKIAKEFVSKFGDDSGYFQQYLFYYKRGL